MSTGEPHERVSVPHGLQKGVKQITAQASLAKA
jgi:hypothetical protein